MALTDQNNMVMPVAPMYGGGNMGGFGGFGGDGWWLILLLLCFNGGWGGFGGFGGMGAAMMDGGFGLYPWLNNSQNINGGFRDQMINDNVTEIRNGVNGIQTQLCNGFADIEQGANTRQMANMQQSFANQTAMMQGFNNMQSQLADCCCENRLAACQTQNIIQNEGNATRFADANNTRDIIDSQTRGTQAILDKLCALELDGVKAQLAQAQRENVGLQNQVNMANLAASQTAQTAQILAGQSAEIDGVYNRLKNCPVPSMPVYGNTPIFTCGNNGGCGCGCGVA
jgi:hypothetical protein